MTSRSVTSSGHPAGTWFVEETSFDFEVACETLPAPLRFTLRHGDTETITIPIGDVCTVAEHGVDAASCASVPTTNGCQP
jgi:hypothetical protein